MWKVKCSVRLLCTAMFMSVSAMVAAQTAANYPTKPVRVILPYAPGGGTWTSARIFADKLSKDTGQNFVVDTRPGGSTVIGTQAVARAAPDGYTLLLTTSSILINHWTQPNLPYETFKDLVGVCTLIRNDHVMVVHPSVPANTLKELIAYARQSPGKINVPTGSTSQITLLFFMQATGTKLNLVPYKGSGSAMTDLLSGYVQLSLNNASNFVPHIKSGKLKGIAISGDNRNLTLPDVPTFAEAGLKGFEAANWHALFAPAATPRAVVEKLNGYVNKAHASPEVQEALAKAGIAAYPNSVAATNAMLRSELQSFGKIIKENNIKAADE